jgi:16S rRNA (guanine527-N7)-methyltransferase
MDLLLQYFPDLTEGQRRQFEALPALYAEWNAQINVVSRKDLDNLMERHVLHSLGIARFFQFEAGQRVLDIGTGGGFPGIPLAIFFPQTQFLLADSIGKKVKVAQAVAEAIGLENVQTVHARAESVEGKFHFAVSRAVAPIGELFGWTRGKLLPSPPDAPVRHGIICLKGGDLSEEIAALQRPAKLFPLKKAFGEAFFETKHVMYVPAA